MPVARELAGLGFRLVATRGTAAYLRAHGLDVDIIFKVNEGRPHVGDELLNGASRSSSTRRSAASRSSTTAPSAAPP